MPEIQTNLERVRERIARAAERAGRSHDDVLLVGVSKTVDVHRIREAVAAGLGALGENRVQEARGKIAEIGRPVKVVATGGLAILFDKNTDVFDVIEPDLTIQGLALLAAGVAK